MPNLNNQQMDPMDLFQAHGIDPNADQLDLFQQHGIEPPKKSFLSSLLPAALRAAQLGLGGAAEFGQGIHNAPHNIANLISPELARYTPQPTHINFGETFGYGKALPMEQLAQLAISAAPYALLAPVGALGSAAAGGIYGLTQSDKPAAAALEGQILGAIPSLAGPAFKALPKAFNFMRPKAHAEAILNELGQGRSIAENTQSIISDLKNAEQAKKAQSAINYGQINDIAKGKQIYPNDKALTQSDYFKKFYSNPKIKDKVGYDIEELHNDFLQKPTYENAHKLQSQLGSEIGKLKSKGPLDSVDSDRLKIYNELRESVKNDVGNFLDKASPGLSDKYKAASDYHLEEVVPYRSIKPVNKAITGQSVNETALLNAFKSPHLKSDVQKIISDLGPEFQNKLIFSKLAKQAPTKKPEALIDAFKRLRDTEQSYGGHITPRLDEQMRALESKLSNKNLFMKGAKLGLPALGIGGAGLGAILKRIPESVSIEGQGGQ